LKNLDEFSLDMLGEVEITFGKFKDHTIKEADVDTLEWYAEQDWFKQYIYIYAYLYQLEKIDIHAEKVKHEDSVKEEDLPF